MSRLSPLDILVAGLFWQLTFLGGCLLAEAVSDPLAIYDTFRVVMPAPVWGAVFVGAGHYLLFAHIRQRRMQASTPFTIKHGRLTPTTRALFSAGMLAFVCFAAIAVTYLVHWGWTITTAQAMYGPAAVMSVFVASEGRPPWK